MAGWLVTLIFVFIVYRVVKSKERRFRPRHRMPRVRSPARPPPLPPGRPLEDRTSPEAQPAPDYAPWREFAEGMGYRFVDARRPEVVGKTGKGRLAITLDSRGRTRVSITPKTPPAGNVSIAPRASSAEAPDRVEIGDPGFDGEFRVSCRWPSLARRLLDERVREWIRALGDARIEIAGGTIRVSVPGLEKDLFRLRGLAETAKALSSRCA